MALMIFQGSALQAEEPATLAIGEKAPAFSLEGIDGKTYTLESFQEAKVLTLIFTANHCPTAQAYEERMKQLSARYAPGEMQLVAISSNHPGAVCLEELGYTDHGHPGGTRLPDPLYPGHGCLQHGPNAGHTQPHAILSLRDPLGAESPERDPLAAGIQSLAG